MRRLPEPTFFLPARTQQRRLETSVEAAVAKTKHTLVVAHRDCPDGVGSYLMHALSAEERPPVVWALPHEMHEVVEQVAKASGEGRTVSVNDLSFNREHEARLLAALREAKGRGWRIEWRDHHHKQWEGIDAAALQASMDRFVLDRDGEECGASLAQKDLAPDDPLARSLAAILRDRDLWINADPRSEDYEFALRQVGTEDFVERFLATRDVDAAWIKNAAAAFRRGLDAEVEKAILTAEVFGDAGEVAVVYGGALPTNAVLHALRGRRGTRLEINLKPEGHFSVRSAPGTEVAHLLGQVYGGGGHPNAAGGRAPVAAWEWPAYWLRGGLSPAGRSVVKTALRLIRQHDVERAAAQPPGGAEPVAAPRAASDAAPVAPKGNGAERHADGRHAAAPRPKRTAPGA